MAENRQSNPWRLAGLGMELAGATLVLGGLGWWIDRELATEPVATIIGGAMGFVGGMYLLIKEAIKANRS